MNVIMMRPDFNAIYRRLLKDPANRQAMRAVLEDVKFVRTLGGFDLSHITAILAEEERSASAETADPDEPRP